VEIVRRTAVVPEHHATRLGDRCDSPRKAARVRPREEVNPLTVQQVADMLARQAGVAPVVADDQFNRSAHGTRIRRPQHEPPLRIDAHWR
jgi:hypothetical protein